MEALLYLIQKGLILDIISVCSPLLNFLIVSVKAPLVPMGPVTPLLNAVLRWVFSIYFLQYTTLDKIFKGGKAGGSCAQGFGVCCVFEMQCGGKTSQNVTYLQLNQTTSGFCKFEVCTSDTSVCRLRLDFESFSLTGPLEDNFPNAVDGVVKNSHSIVGQCLSDNLVVSSAEGPSPPMICGQNTGQHMYTSLAGCGCVTVSAYISTDTFDRSLNIKATQVSPTLNYLLVQCIL